MKVFERVLSLAALIFVVGFVAACGSAGGQGEGSGGEEPELRVSATMSVIEDLATQVGGDRVEVSSIVPVGGSPETFQPSPQDAARISEANVVLENGAGLDDWVEDLIESAGNENQTVVELSEGLEPAGEAHDHAEGESHEGEEHSHEGESHEGESHEGESHGDDEHSDEHGGEVSCHGEGDDFHCDGLPEGATCELGEDGEITCEGLPEGASCHGTEADFHCHGLEEEHSHEGEAHSDEAHSDEAHSDEHSHEGETHSDEAHADEAGHEGHAHAEGNPHYWLDVENAQAYVEKIRDAFIEADPEGAEEYEANAEEYLATLDELDEYIRSETENIPEENRKLVTFHEAFPYFAEAYGYEEVAVILRNPDAEPSSRAVAETVTAIEEEGVPAIYTEPQFNQGPAETVADEAGVEMYEIYADTLIDDSSANTYEAMMRTNVDRLVEGLG